MNAEGPKSLTREQALAHFRVAVAKMIKHLERAGVLEKPRVRVEIVEVTSTGVTLQIVIPRYLIPDLIVLRPDDLAGYININTADLVTGNLYPIDPLEAEDDADR